MLRSQDSRVSIATSTFMLQISGTYCRLWLEHWKSSQQGVPGFQQLLPLPSPPLCPRQASHLPVDASVVGYSALIALQAHLAVQEVESLNIFPDLLLHNEGEDELQPMNARMICCKASARRIWSLIAGKFGAFFLFNFGMTSD